MYEEERPQDERFPLFFSSLYLFIINLLLLGVFFSVFWSFRPCRSWLRASPVKGEVYGRTGSYKGMGMGWESVEGAKHGILSINLFTWTLILDVGERSQ